MENTKTSGGKKIALVIAVSDYDDKKNINQLPFCKSDGERMTHLLQSLGYEIPEGNKIVGQVQWQAMRKALRNFFTQQCKNSKDTLLFYFSGHGLVHNNIFYLATSEIDPYSPYDSGIDDHYLKAIIDDSPSQKIVMILDSCHSGKLNLFSKSDPQSAASIASDTVNKMNIAEGRFLLASCQGYQESIGAQDGSKFTQYVIEGLKGNKDSVDKDGYVTPDSLAKYIYGEMMSHPEKDGAIQKPIKKVEGSGEIILATHEKFRQQQNDHEISEMRKKIEEDFHKLDEIRIKGFALSEKGQYEEAISYYDKALEIDPKNVLALYNKGLSLISLHRHQEAISYFDKALEINPKHVDTLSNKGLALDYLGKYEDAISYYDKTLEIDPKHVNALSNKGLVLYHLRKYEEAISYFDKALEIEPKIVNVLGNKGAALANLGKYEDAISCYDKALEIDPKNVNTLRNKGLALNHLGKYEEAISCFDKILKIDPKDSAALYNIACSKSLSGKIDEAIDLLEKAIALDVKYKDKARNDNDFVSIRSNSKFQMLIK